MANIIYTNKCNLSCPFCFANENNSDDGKDKFSSIKLWRTVNFLNENPVRFCGGEPTQHPDIIEHIDLLLKSGKSAFVMTNGVWPKNFLNYIKDLPPASQLKVSFLFNILHPTLYTVGQLKAIENTLEACLSNRVTLGFTIYKADFEYEYIIELAKKYNVGRIRWSVSNTNLENVNLKEYFHKVAQRIEMFLTALEENGLKSIHDCGYVPLCFYSIDQLHRLNFLTSNSMKVGCKNSPLDVDNKGNTWRCFGLYNWIKAPIEKFENTSKLKNYYDRRIRVLNQLYLFKECKNCKYHNKSCGGGCYALRIKNAQKNNAKVCLNPIDDDEEILKIIPERAKSIRFKQYSGHKVVYASDKAFPNLDYNTLVFLETIDGNKSILELINLWKDNFSSYEKAKSTLINLCRTTFEKDLINVRYDFTY